jgi:hypothetical protein
MQVKGFECATFSAYQLSLLRRGDIERLRVLECKHARLSALGKIERTDSDLATDILLINRTLIDFL